MANTSTKGFILEISKSIDENKTITYLNKDNNTVQNAIFIYDKKEKNTSRVKFNIKNEHDDDVFVCIHKSEGENPFIREVKCSDIDKIKINKKSDFEFMFDNPYCKENEEDGQYYLSIEADKNVSIEYNYEENENGDKKENKENKTNETRNNEVDKKEKDENKEKKNEENRNNNDQNNDNKNNDGNKGEKIDGKKDEKKDENKGKKKEIKKKDDKKEENKEKTKIKSKEESKNFFYYEIFPCYSGFKNGNDKVSNLNMIQFDKPIPSEMFEEFKNNLLGQLNNNLGSGVCRFNYAFTEPKLLESKNDKFNNNINFINEDNKLKFSLETPFFGEIEINTLFLLKTNLEFENNCAIVDYKNKLKESGNNKDEILIERTSTVEPNQSIKYEISVNEVKDIVQQKNFKILVVTKHKKLNFEVSYNPYFSNRKLKIKFTEEKKTDQDINIESKAFGFHKYIIYIVIGIALFICLIICLVYCLCRFCHRQQKKDLKSEENSSLGFEFY